MTQDQYPVGSPGEGGRLPARHDVRLGHELMRPRSQELALDLRDEREERAPQGREGDADQQQIIEQKTALA